MEGRAGPFQRSHENAGKLRPARQDYSHTGRPGLPSGKVLEEISPSPTCRLPVGSLVRQPPQADPKVPLELS